LRWECAVFHSTSWPSSLPKVGLPRDWFPAPFAVGRCCALHYLAAIQPSRVGRQGWFPTPPCGGNVLFFTALRDPPASQVGSAGGGGGPTALCGGSVMRFKIRRGPPAPPGWVNNGGWGWGSSHPHAVGLCSNVQCLVAHPASQGGSARGGSPHPCGGNVLCRTVAGGPSSLPGCVCIGVAPPHPCGGDVLCPTIRGGPPASQGGLARGGGGSPHPRAVERCFTVLGGSPASQGGSAGGGGGPAPLMRWYVVALRPPRVGPQGGWLPTPPLRWQCVVFYHMWGHSCLPGWACMGWWWFPTLPCGGKVLSFTVLGGSPASQGGSEGSWGGVGWVGGWVVGWVGGWCVSWSRSWPRRRDPQGLVAQRQGHHRVEHPSR
jgi:hypothetical protein